MSMREQERITGTVKRAINHSLSPGGNLPDTLAARHTIAPKGPAGPPALNLGSSAPLILSVIPLPQICVYRRAAAIASKPASLPRSLQWTRQHKIKGAAVQESPDFARDAPPRASRADPSFQ
jgi:hypothetical protein